MNDWTRRELLRNAGKAVLAVPLVRRFGGDEQPEESIEAVDPQPRDLDAPKTNQSRSIYSAGRPEDVEMWGPLGTSVYMTVADTLEVEIPGGGKTLFTQIEGYFSEVGVDRFGIPVALR